MLSDPQNHVNEVPALLTVEEAARVLRIGRGTCTGYDDELGVAQCGGVGAHRKECRRAQVFRRHFTGRVDVKRLRCA